jgi:hypothetical protein
LFVWGQSGEMKPTINCSMEAVRLLTVHFCLKLIFKEIYLNETHIVVPFLHDLHRLILYLPSQISSVSYYSFFAICSGRRPHLSGKKKWSYENHELK